MIWAGLKSVRRAMFRETESRVTMETRLQVQQCREYWISSCESYTMSQTDIRNSNQYQQAPVKTRPSHSSAAEFDFLSRCWGGSTLQMSSCHDLSVCQPCLQTHKLSKFRHRRKSLKFFWQPQLLSAYQSARSKHGFKLSQSPCGRTRGCVCIFPTAAPGLHLIRPLFLSCPNRQALWVMNISRAAFQQQQVSVSVPVSSQWLWSAVLLHPKDVCVHVCVRERESKRGSCAKVYQRVFFLCVTQIKRVWHRSVYWEREEGVCVFVRWSHNEAAPRWRRLTFIPEGLLGKEQRCSRVTLFALDNLSAQRKNITSTGDDSNKDGLKHRQTDGSGGSRVCSPSNTPLPSTLPLKPASEQELTFSIKCNQHLCLGATTTETFQQVT